VLAILCTNVRWNTRNTTSSGSSDRNAIAMIGPHQVLGTTVHTYLTDRRIAEAQRQLLTTTATTRRIAEDAGFGSHSGFHAAFTQACGMPPGRYRRLHQGR
jgi:methylphosphotriester-DNA--protein-cysteine methyltransferase